jgi:carbamoyl-phosphate synthase large subunit
MIKKQNILVTGCGGDIGQSIGKILNESELVKNLFGIDISDKNAGKFIYDNFSLGVPCSNDNYISFLEMFVKKNSIDLIIPISEPELRFFSETKCLSSIVNAKLITASELALEIGFDKFKTALFLKRNNLNFPQTYLISDFDSPKEFPFIIKSNYGSGSSDIHIVNDIESFIFLKQKYPDFIVQEYLDDSQGEYTCCVFRSSGKIVRTIIMKRQLSNGYSNYGEVTENKEIDQLLISIANFLNLKGSINVQLRLTKNGPKVFEINPRFSSTVLFRHMLNFRDLIWSIEDILNISLSEYKNDSNGKKFYKGYSEYLE